MKLTPQQKLKFYRNRELVRQVILQDAVEDSHIIFGSEAINVQVPVFLRRATEDVDLKVNNPKREALEVEKKLDKLFGGDFFRVEESEKFKDVWKVRSNITNKGVADYSRGKVKEIVSVLGNKFKKISAIRKEIEKTLRQKKAEFRRDKDMETLERIKLSQQLGEF